MAFNPNKAGLGTVKLFNPEAFMITSELSCDKDGNFTFYNRYLLSPFKAFFYTMACHLRPEFAQLDKTQVHYDWVTTVGLMTSIFINEDVEGDTLLFCKACTLCRAKQWVDVNLEKRDTSVLLDNLHHDQDKSDALLKAGLQGTTIPLVAEEAMLTEMLIENFEDFKWTELRKFFHYIVRRFAESFGDNLLHNSYLMAPDCNTFENDIYRFEADAKYDPSSLNYKFDWNLMQSASAVIDFLQFLGIGENLSTFAILNKVLKIHYLHYWRTIMNLQCIPASVLANEIHKYTKGTKFHDDQLQNIYFLQSSGPYLMASKDGRIEEVRLVITQHVVSSELSYMFLNPHDDIYELIKARLKCALDSGRKFDYIVVDTMDWLSSLVSSFIWDNVTINLCQLISTRDCSHFFLKYIIDCHLQIPRELEAIPILDFIPIIIALHNKSYIPHVKAVVSLQ